MMIGSACFQCEKAPPDQLIVLVIISAEWARFVLVLTELRKCILITGQVLGLPRRVVLAVMDRLPSK